MKMIFIYTLKESIDGPIRYIGQTNDLKRRLYRHLSNSRSYSDNRHISNWIRSLKEKPIMEVIEECSYIDRNIRENFWINYYTKQGNDLCNSSKGGAGAGIGNKNSLGRKLSIETKRKISLSNKGKPGNKTNKGGRPSHIIYQYNKERQLISTYNSITEASKATNINRTTIRRNIKNINPSRYFIWSYKLL